MGLDSGQLAQVSLMSQIGGAATSAIGGYYSSASEKSNLQLQSAVSSASARIADTNARLSEMSAQSALYQGQQQVGALTLKAGQMKSSQRASLAANGVDLGEGSSAEIQASTDLMKEVDANTIHANAVSNAWGYRIAGTNAQAQAASLRSDALLKSASASSISPLASSATSLLGSAGSVASSWYRLGQNNGLKGTMFELAD